MYILLMTVEDHRKFLTNINSVNLSGTQKVHLYLKFNHWFKSSPGGSQMCHTQPFQIDYFQDLKYISEGGKHSGTAVLDCKFHLKDYHSKYNVKCD